MVRNKKILFGIILIISLSLIWIVIAATGDAIKIRSPVSISNFSASNITGNIPVLFNITFLNGTGLEYDVVNASLTTLNVTFYINISATGWFIVGNSTHCISYNGVEANISCTAYLNASAIDGNQNNMTGNGSIVSDGIYSVNATIFNNTAARLLSRGIKAGNLTVIIIDNSEPSKAEFNGPTSGTNHSVKSNSGNLTINISAVDILSNISSVTFFLINETGSLGGNTSISGIQEGTTTYWSTSINTTHLLDGTYNITATVQDRAGNFNKTANATTYSSSSILRKIIIDHTPPTSSPSCSPITVTTSSSFPCSCTGTDSLSGVATTSGTSTSPNGVSTPTLTGTFTYTCVVTDKAGNSKSDSTTYSVIEPGSSSPSSSSSSGSSSSGTSSNTGSGSTNPPTSSSTTGSESGTNTGATGQGQENTPPITPEKINTKWIIAIIIIIILAVAITFFIKRKK